MTQSGDLIPDLLLAPSTEILPSALPYFLEIAPEVLVEAVEAVVGVVAVAGGVGARATPL